MNDLRHELSRRERQVMDVLFRLGEAAVADVRENMADPPSYSAVRTHLRILEEKGHVTHEQQGPRYVYRPVVARDRAKRSALQHVIDTFFEGSAGKVMVSLLADRQADLSETDLDRLAELVERARLEQDAGTRNALEGGES